MNRPRWMQPSGQSLVRIGTGCTSCRAVLFVLAVCVVLVTASGRTVLAQWALFSHQKALLGKAIVDVGEVRSQYASPLSGLDRRREWLEFHGQEERCMDASGLPVGGSEAALLLVDKDQGLYLAVVKSSIGSVDVDVDRVRLIQCPR